MAGILFNRVAFRRPQKAIKLDNNMIKAFSPSAFVKPRFGTAMRIMPLAAMAFAALFALGSTARAQDAAAVANELHAGLEHLMANGEAMGLEAASDYIGGVVDETYDLPALTAQSIGPASFRSYDDAGKAQVVAAYREFVIANYVSRFARKLPITFKTLGTSPGPKGATVVNTELQRQSGEPVNLDYVVRTPEEGRAGIADVLYNGVSEAARRRSELSSLARLGAEPLADALSRKASTIAATQQ